MGNSVKWPPAVEDSPPREEGCKHWQREKRAPPSLGMKTEAGKEAIVLRVILAPALEGAAKE